MKNSGHFKESILNQKGQAIFELILFLPFLMFLYTIYYTCGNSINGSINQQKAVRGYFYNLVKGNSYLNTTSDLIEHRKKLGPNVIVGFNAIGWRDHSDGSGLKAFAPCFKFSSLLKNGSTEECDSANREAERESRFIRIFTFYGVCGPTYVLTGDFEGKEYFEMFPSVQASPGGSCLIGDPEK